MKGRLQDKGQLLLKVQGVAPYLAAVAAKVLEVVLISLWEPQHFCSGGPCRVRLLNLPPVLLPMGTLCDSVLLLYC